MALKQDERALLQLVCEREQSYADLAELLGITTDEVKSKARAALTELGGADPDAEVGLTDYLLGQADPIGRADAVRFLQQDSEARVLAETIETKLRAIAPAAELPKLPEPKGKRRKAASLSPAETAEADAAASGMSASSKAGEPAGSRTARSVGQNRLMIGMALAGVVILVVILAVAGVFSSSDDAAAPDQQAADDQRAVTTVPLQAQGGSGVVGTADFGLANDNLFVDLDVSGLDPELGGNSVYVLWLMLNDNGGYPVSIIVPNRSGRVQDRYAVPTPVAVAIASNAQFVQISESPSRELRGEIDSAVEAGAPLVPFSGTSLSRGRIPVAEQATDEGGAGEGGAGAEAGAGAGTTPTP